MQYDEHRKANEVTRRVSDVEVTDHGKADGRQDEHHRENAPYDALAKHSSPEVAWYSVPRNQWSCIVATRVGCVSLVLDFHTKCGFKHINDICQGGGFYLATHTTGSIIDGQGCAIIVGNITQHNIYRCIIITEHTYAVGLFIHTTRLLVVRNYRR